MRKKLHSVRGLLEHLVYARHGLNLWGESPL